MARKFNLQPWRARRREGQKKQFVIICGATALICAALFYGYYLLQKQYIRSQEQAIATLQNNIKKFKRAQDEVARVKALNEEVARQISVIQGLEAQRGLTLKILNYMAKQTPDTVFLEEVAYKNNNLTISGIAENETGVSALIRKLDEFPNFASVVLINMHKAKNTSRFSVTDDTEVKAFTLVVYVVTALPPSEKEERS